MPTHFVPSLISRLKFLRRALATLSLCAASCTAIAQTVAPSTALGSTSATQTVTLTFTAAGTAAQISVLTQGAANKDFQYVAGGTCDTITLHSSGDTCTVNYTFTPTHPGTRTGAITLVSSTPSTLATTLISGLGSGSQLIYPDSSTATVTTLVNGGGSTGYHGVTYDGSGNLYYSGSGSSGFVTMSSASGSRTIGTFSDPRGLAVDGAGDLFVADAYTSLVYEFVAVNGVIPASPTPIALSNTTGVTAPYGIALDASGNLFEGGTNKSPGYELVEYTAASGYSTSFLVTNLPYIITGLVVDSAENIWASEDNDGIAYVQEVEAVDGVLPASPTVRGLSITFGDLYGIAQDPAGDLYVVDYITDEIEELTAVNGVVPSSPAVIVLGSYLQSYGVTVDPSGNLVMCGNEGVTKLDIVDNAPSITFPSTPVGYTSSSASVTVENVGTAPLTFPVPGSGTNPAAPSPFALSPASSCEYATSSSSSPGSQPPGPACTFAVTYSPTVQNSGDTGTLIATDNSLGLSNATQSFALSGTNYTPNVVLGITSLHTPSTFLQGENGATYKLTPSNSGTTPTYGPLTLVDTLPAGLTATAMTGSGWSCTLATLTCTSSTVIAAAGNGNAITLTVDVSATAGSGNNSVTLSGGSASPPASLIDPTTVSPQQTIFVVNNVGVPTTGNATNCNTGNSGTCTLEDAFTGMNALVSAATSLTFDSTVFNSPTTLTLQAALPSLTVTGNQYSITGPAAALTISGNNAYRPLTITGTGTTVSVNGLTFSDGSASTAGGCVSNAGVLTLTNVTVTGCKSTATGATGGGGIYNTGTLSLSGVTVSSNSAAYGGGIFTSVSTLSMSGSTVTNNTATTAGGGIYGSTTFTLNGTSAVDTISNNTAPIGGGIDSGTGVTLTGVTISGNTASTGAGGGVAGHVGPGSGTVSLTGCTISGNQAKTAGGGIYGATGVISSSTISGNSSGTNGAGINISGATTLTNSTISGNSSVGNGAGIYTGYTTITNSTIANNSATNGIGGIDSTSTSAATVLNNVTLVGNTNNGVASGFSGAKQATGANNILVGCVADCPADSTEVTSATDLSTLGSYGGTVQTILPLPGSTAIGGGSACTTSTDERGYTRPTSGMCDSGAVQTNYGVTWTTQPPSSTPVATNFTAGVTLTEQGNALSFATAQAMALPVTLATSGTGTLTGSPLTVLSTTGAAAGAFQVSANATTNSLTATAGTASAISNDFVVGVVTPAPTVTGISPTGGSTAGGTSVVITGTGFTAASAVTFGTTPATSYVVNSDTQVTAVSPAASAGTVDVQVTTTGGTSSTSAADQFTDYAPQGFLVTTLSDDATATAGNCVPNAVDNSGGNSACSFRDAIAAANALHGPVATINFYSGLSALSSATRSSPAQYSVSSNGTLNITGAITVNGPTGTDSLGTFNELAIEGGGDVQIVNVNATSNTVDLKNLTFDHGGLDSATGGGANLAVTSGTVNVSNSTFSNSEVLMGAVGGGMGVLGGAVTVSDCTFIENSAVYNSAGGGLGISGGTVTVTNSTFNDNTTVYGAKGSGVAVTGGTMTMVNSTVSGNTVGYAGNTGGIYVAGTLNLANSDVTGNSTDITGSYTDDGGNLVGSGSFASLGSYGGSTQTLLPVPGSASICAGLATIGGVTVPTTDQRGVSAGAGGYCPSGSIDSGAVQTDYALGYSQQPTNANTGTAMSPAPGVQLLENGLPYTGSTPSISLTDADSAIASGNTATNSPATFPSLIFNTLETGDTLTASTSITLYGSSPSTLQLTSSPFNVLPPAPTVTGISPTGGSTAGGTSVVITGTGFTAASAVTFGTTPATSYVVNSDIQVTAISPAASAGTVDITVTAAGGPSTTSSADQFTYAAPAAGSIAAANLGANQVTLQLTSSATGTGYFTLLNGASATCGSATQTAAGEDSNSTAVIHGSLSLTAATAGSFTVRNLAQSTAYTVCFTPDGSATPVTTNVTTTAEIALGSSVWTNVGNAAFSGATTSNTSLAFAPDGTPYVAFEDGNNSYYATVMKFSGGSWTLVGAADFSGSEADLISLAFSPDGTPYVVYRDDGNSEAITVMKFNGTSWVTVGAPDFSPSDVTTTSLAFSPAGVPYVAYDDNVNNGKATVMMFNGASWVAVGSPDFSSGPIGFGTLVFSPVGVPYLAYRDSSKSAAATVMMFNGTSWVAVGDTGFTPNNVFSLTFAFTPAGVPYVAYQDSSSDRPASAMMFNGSEWVQVGNAGFSAGRASTTFLAISPAGVPYVTYEDNVNSNKLTTMEYNGTAWVNAGNAGFTAGDGFLPSMAFSPNGTPMVAFQDNANNGDVTVMQLVPIPTATTGAASSITTTSATLNGTVNDNGVATTIAFEYGTTTSYGTTVAATTPGGGTLAAGTGSTAASVDIGSLTPGMTYHFRVDATGNGVTVNGSDATFTATPLAPVVTGISPNSGTTAGSTFVTITGTGLTGATAVQFGATSANDVTVVSDTEITAVAPAGSEGTVDVTVTTSGGTSTTSPADQFSYATVPDAPTIGVATAGDGTATVSFTPPASDGGSPITSYAVTSSPASAIVAGSGSPIVVSGLTNGIQYTFTVTATNAIGASLPSSASNSITPETGAGAYIWLVYNDGTVSKQTEGGSTIVSSAGTSSATSTLGGAAIDGNGAIWSVSSANNQLQFASKTGTGAMVYTGGGLSTPVAVAVDGAGYIWVANSGNATVSEFNATGAAVSPTAGYSTVSNGPSGIAIDAAGSVWTSNSTDSTVTRIVGAATPAVTPLAAAEANGDVGTTP